ncbi:LysM peptidoglycan-binding domain-containing protein [Brevibacillus composti]|uniref:LysM peptidoglycan-binding domain-containing protein n=1 Tax=Brevibacillus composti TaxID=2796470 RepID=A0A7T5EMZ2_9BACL|nr:LysM peptidoglycan-binding domain-containing protein [Brevibacillus composti]QQE75603.1 LysM peptidoglycan-binding domain-containing protein [Brevibacillus composti]QUO42629.1 LysM peptidoglycan-binding domain-containing protein [Brevibacillus composti]
MKSTSWKRIVSLLLAASFLPAAHASAETITVKAGDTLGNIAYRHNVTVDQLKAANQLKSDMLLVGQSLYIPSASQVYTVHSGDVLWKIADAFNTTIPAIMEANRMTSTDLLAGQTLLIPSSQTAPAPAPSPTAPYGSTRYTVVKGDMLWKIAERFQVSISAIVEANQLKSSEIWIGQKLVIPQKQVSSSEPVPVTPDKPSVTLSSYTVKKGDTPWTISIAHGIPRDEFLQVNKFSESDYLQIGQTVKIPVHHIPVTSTPGEAYGEYLDWFEAAQYLMPIHAVAVVTDFETKKQFRVKRTIGAFHSDTEPLTAADAAMIKEVWGGRYSWQVRPVVVEVNGRKLAASMTSMPHSMEYIADNNFDGHFDIHFRNSLRHKDNLIDPDHQAAIKTAAGLAR